MNHITIAGIEDDPKEANGNVACSVRVSTGEHHLEQPTVTGELHPFGMDPSHERRPTQSFVPASSDGARRNRGSTMRLSARPADWRRSRVLRLPRSLRPTAQSTTSCDSGERLTRQPNFGESIFRADGAFCRLL